MANASDNAIVCVCRKCRLSRHRGWSGKSFVRLESRFTTCACGEYCGQWIKGMQLPREDKHMVRLKADLYDIIDDEPKLVWLVWLVTLSGNILNSVDNLAPLNAFTTHFCTTAMWRDCYLSKRRRRRKAGAERAQSGCRAGARRLKISANIEHRMNAVTSA